MERAFGGAFVVVALALALAGEWGGASLVAVAGATLAFVVSARVEFDISGGFVAPTQLAFEVNARSLTCCAPALWWPGVQSCSISVACAG